jgi:hypothetical protein
MEERSKKCTLGLHISDAPRFKLDGFRRGGKVRDLWVRPAIKIKEPLTLTLSP